MGISGVITFHWIYLSVRLPSGLLLAFDTGWSSMGLNCSYSGTFAASEAGGRFARTRGATGLVTMLGLSIVAGLPERWVASVAGLNM